MFSIAIQCGDRGAVFQADYVLQLLYNQALQPHRHRRPSGHTRALVRGPRLATAHSIKLPTHTILYLTRA